MRCENDDVDKICQSHSHTVFKSIVNISNALKDFTQVVFYMKRPKQSTPVNHGNYRGAKMEADRTFRNHGCRPTMYSPKHLVDQQPTAPYFTAIT